MFISQIKFPLLEQSISSSINFFLTIFLIRIFDLKVFGIFSLYYLILHFLYGLQISLFVYSLNSNFSKINHNLKYNFLINLIIQNTIFCFFASLIIYFVLTILDGYFSNYLFDEYKLIFSLICFFFLFYQFLRRILIIKKFYFKQIIINISILLSLASFYFISFKFSGLKSFFFVFFLTYLVTSIIAFCLIFKGFDRFNKFFYHLSENINSSKWLVLTNFIQWFGSNLWLINSSVILGPKILGVLRGCQSIVNFASIFFQTFENIIPNEVSKKYFNLGKSQMIIFLKNFTKKNILFFFILSLFLILFHKEILNFFYPGKYDEYSYILGILSLTILLNFLSFPSIYGLRTIHKTNYIFHANLIISIFAVLFSHLILINFGIDGLIVGLVFNQAFISLYLYLKLRIALKL